MIETARPVVVRAGARLHFGLTDTRPPFGGIGLMIDSPFTEVRVTPHASWRCDGYADRIEPVARRMPGDLPPARVWVPRRPPPHAGFGTGTTLAVAVADALSQSLGHDRSPDAIRRWAGRGLRSRVGEHGYFRGGLVSHLRDDDPVHVTSLPSAWRVVTWSVGVGEAISGGVERAGFDGMDRTSTERRRKLERLIDELHEAAAGGRAGDFGKALTRYNRMSGEMFAGVQGGPYADAAIERRVESVQRFAPEAGVGQSSWGPTVFAVVPDAGRAGELVERFEGGVVRRLTPVSP